MTCTFCQIAKGELPAHIVHRDEQVVAFLDRAPLLAGHVLVMPTDHVETLDDLPDGLLAPVFAAVRRTSVAVQKAFRTDPIGLPLHPVAILLLLAVQWYAILRALIGKPVGWKGRNAPTPPRG